MLKIKNLSFKIKDKDATLLSHIDLEMEAGKAYVLSGKNGSGKSSLLSAIMGHPSYEIVAGSIEIDDVNIEINNVEASVRSGMYMAMQMVPEIEGVTMIQLLHKAVNKKENKNIIELNKELISYCEQFGIDRAYIARDLNYKMSGGEKKQSELLHILALKPKYILIDEIDSGVDKESIDKIFKVLNYMIENNNSSLLIISHHTDVGQYIKIEKEYSI